MKRTTTGLRLEKGKHEELEEIAKPYHTNPSALIRLAVDQLIIATKDNNGQLPEPLALRAKEETGFYGRSADKPEAAAAVVGGGQ